MSKKNILWIMFGLSVLALNFISYEKAVEATDDSAYEAYKEFFDSSFKASFTPAKAKKPVRAMTEELYRIGEGPMFSPVFADIKKYKVKATIYKAAYPMTDITASGKLIDTMNASSHRWIAVSRDLQKEGFTFGAKVLIIGTGTHDGVWEVQDVMNKRWKRRIDFLSDYYAPNNYWKDVTIRILD